MRKTNPLHLFTFGLQRTAGPYRWVKLRNTQREQMFSGLPRVTDIVRPVRLVRFVPNPEVAASLDPSSTSGSKVAGTPAKRMAKKYFVPSFEARL
jgi:hypothetical protein